MPRNCGHPAPRLGPYQIGGRVPDFPSPGGQGFFMGVRGPSTPVCSLTGWRIAPDVSGQGSFDAGYAPGAEIHQCAEIKSPFHIPAPERGGDRHGA